MIGEIDTSGRAIAQGVIDNVVPDLFDALHKAVADTPGSNGAKHLAFSLVLLQVQRLAYDRAIGHAAQGARKQLMESIDG